MQITFLQIIPTLLIGVGSIVYGGVLWNYPAFKFEAAFGLSLSLSGFGLAMFSIYTYDPVLFTSLFQ